MAEPLSPQHRPAPPAGAAGTGLGWTDGMMLFTAILFGSSFPLAKPILPAMDPLFYASARYALSATVVFGALWLRGHALGLANADRKSLLRCSIIFAAFQLDWAFALSRSNASVGAIFMATSPIFGALLARLAGHRLQPAGWLGIFVAFCGVSLVINNSLSEITVTFGSLFIDFLWLANAVLWALYVGHSPALIVDLGPTRMLAWVMLISALLMAPLGLWGGLQMDWPGLPPTLWFNFVYTALVTGALAAIFWNYGLRRLGITRTMIYMYLMPVVAVAFAVIFLGEALTLARSIGGIAVLAGIWVTRRAAG